MQADSIEISQPLAATIHAASHRTVCLTLSPASNQHTLAKLCTIHRLRLARRFVANCCNTQKRRSVSLLQISSIAAATPPFASSTGASRHLTNSRIMSAKPAKPAAKPAAKAPKAAGGPTDPASLDSGEYTACLSAKQIKALARPEFSANPEKFYPTQTLRNLGFTRAHCECGNNYWRASEARTTCGDSNCEKKYTFIGKGTGRGDKQCKDYNPEKLTYSEAWAGFKRSLTTAAVPCTAIKRYPVVARWRADVDYVAAGIFCFQPYVVTGEVEPPANPLICPQFWSVG